MKGIRSSRVLTDEGQRDAVVLIDGEHIADVVAPGAAPSDAAIEDLGDLVLMPGLVDTHVHVNEPGRTEWEGFETVEEMLSDMVNVLSANAKD